MTHEHYMQRAIELAEKGLGRTSPNPLVGAVIVHENQIIGEGYHQSFGLAHAEVNAIESVKDKSLLKNSKIYVTLEPCSHFGKTPPCADLILEHKIPKVIIANKDPNIKVAGNGIKKLENHGVEVIQGILEDSGNWLNRRFFTSHIKKRPYIILKWAQNQSGLMDTQRDDSEKGINWITEIETKTTTHEWRSQEDAILVGANTVLTDSPSLTTRHAGGKSPIRLVLDPNHTVPDNHPFWTSSSKSFVFSKDERQLPKNSTSICIDPKKNTLNQVITHLHNLKINSVIVEGGKFTIDKFIEQNLWDEARILRGTNHWKEGLKAPVLSGLLVSENRIGNDALKTLVAHDLSRP